MVNLSHETEVLAAQLASEQCVSVDTAIRLALEAQVRLNGLILTARPRRRMTIAQMTNFGIEIAALPLLDSRSPNEIMDDINAP
jgi:antitoxin VapB